MMAILYLSVSLAVGSVPIDSAASQMLYAPNAAGVEGVVSK